MSWLTGLCAVRKLTLRRLVALKKPSLQASNLGARAMQMLDFHPSYFSSKAD
ncbi:hypothetical protein thsrh120_61460 [Rhizobium sp. No.120]